MVTESGLVKLMDFGVAKSLGDLRLTDGGSMIGSLYYMSPEQVKGSVDPDPRSDIYSAGAILYEVVTGKKPFDYEDRFSLMVAQVEEQPRPPSEIDPGIPAKLDDIILKALAKEPSERYASASEFVEALQIIKQPVPASASKLAARPKRPLVSEAAAGAAVLVICALAGMGSVAWNRVSQPIPAPTVVRAVPSAPENLAAIPPAPAASASPASVHEEPAPAPVQPAPALKPVVAADSPKTRKTPRETTARAIDPKADEAPQADEVQSTSPASKRAEPLHTAQQGVESQPAEAKKGHFWGKLNPFHKANPFKKKKEDSALRSPDDAASTSRQ
jgi:serine/threonine-protein kinase